MLRTAVKTEVVVFGKVGDDAVAQLERRVGVRGRTIPLSNSNLQLQLLSHPSRERLWLCVRAPLLWIGGEASVGVEKNLRLENVTDVDHPHIAHSVFPAFRHQFVPHERGRRRAEMDVAMRRAMVGRMPVDSPAVSLALRAADTTHIAEVVVRPHDRRVLRNLKPRIEYRKNLLVRNEEFWRTFRKHCTLRGKNFLENLDLLLRRLAVLHLSIVDSAHADRPQNIFYTIYTFYTVRKTSPTSHALFPVVNEEIAVSDPAPLLLVFL